MENKKHKFDDDIHEKIIWKGHYRHISMIHFHILSLLITIGILFLMLQFDIKFLFLLVIPLVLSTTKYMRVKRNTFEINTTRIVMVKYEMGKYMTYEVELYDVKHMHVEAKRNKKGHIVFKTASSLFPEIKSPWMKHPAKVHHKVRNISEKLKEKRLLLMQQQRVQEELLK